MNLTPLENAVNANPLSGTPLALDLGSLAGALGMQRARRVQGHGLAEWLRRLSRGDMLEGWQPGA